MAFLIVVKALDLGQVLRLLLLLLLLRLIAVRLVLTVYYTNIHWPGVVAYYS